SPPNLTGDRPLRASWVSPSRPTMSLPVAPARNVPVSIRAREILSLREENRAEGPALPSEIIGWKANVLPEAPSNFGALSTAPPTLRYQFPENQPSACACVAPSTRSAAVAAPTHFLTISPPPTHYKGRFSA